MKPIKILHLYPDRMNIYGDFGNVISLMKRIEWRGLKFDYQSHDVGDSINSSPDIVFMGGGQDSGQTAVARDLMAHKALLTDHFLASKPVLTICGGYQLFGEYFVPQNGSSIKGIGIYNIVTEATDLRMIGNIVVESDTFGELVGFENHSGETELEIDEKPLGKVKKGYGNTKDGRFEGIIKNNAIGTYMHGSFLPKNPIVADYLIQKAVDIQDASFVLKPLDDSLETIARDLAKKLP